MKQLKALQAQHTDLSKRHTKLEQALVSQPPIPLSSIADQTMVRSRFQKHHLAKDTVVPVAYCNCHASRALYQDVQPV